jgi:hypothetical protein
MHFRPDCWARNASRSAPGFLDGAFKLNTRLQAFDFCDTLDPRFVDIQDEVRDTRGMPRSEKALYCTGLACNLAFPGS